MDFIWIFGFYPMYFACPYVLADFFQLQVGKSDKTYLRLVSCDLKTADGTTVKGYNIGLKDALAAGASVNLEVELVLDNMLKMYPAELTQKESQLVMFTGNHYVFSPYKVKTQSTKVTLTTDKAPESYSKVKLI